MSHKYLSHGVLEDIEKIALEDIKDEHEKMMKNDEAVILIAGHLDKVTDDSLKGLIPVMKQSVCREKDTASRK